MFFVISKILDFVVTPMFWIFILLLIAVVSAKRRKRALITAFVVTLLFSNMFIVDEFVRAWELSLTSYESIDNDYDVAIVLGGGVFFDEQYQRANYGYNFHRYYDAMVLYKMGKVKKLLITGGSGALVNTHIKEAEYIRQLWLQFGVPDEDIIMESESRNTHENAVETKKVLKGLDIEGKFLLVTSATHMRRALACFSKEEIEVVPFCADKKTGPRKFYPDYLLVPKSSALGRWNVLLHEWIGCITYKVAGYI